ncbi:MAG: hypothetical protein FWD00_01220 [Clostridiales bacterium]|nr:hypothetical protein [Clostridiales bacterium]
MLKVIQFIKENPDWRQRLSCNPYNLFINDDKDFTILKYSQRDSDFNNEIVRECRGIIIDKDCNPVCIPFFKFGNYGEPYADIIDWETAKVEEKIDGSLIKVWNYRGKWIISTNGTIFAEKAAIGAADEKKANTTFNNFAELFENARINSKLDFDFLNPQYTYMFEIVSPYNRIVALYDSIDIYHIGTRDNTTLLEIEIDIGIKKPRTYLCNSLKDLIEMASTLRYCEEGYVVKDKNYKRIKVKSPAYVAVHHLISGMNEKGLLELMRTNEANEFLTYFPEYKQNIDILSEKIDRLISHIEEILESKISGVNFETRKDFALIVTQTKYPAFFFNYYDGKEKNPLKWLWSMPNDKIIEHLNRLED